MGAKHTGRAWHLMENAIKGKKLILIGLVLSLTYLILAMYAIPQTGLAWDESRHLSGGKARAYSIYTAVSGSPPLAMCSLVDPPEDEDTYGRCWSGRPRLSQTASGFTWAAIWFLNGMHLDFLPSIAAHRISTALFVAICIFFVFMFGAEAFGTRVGFLSAISLITIPRFFAHSLYVTLDAPVAAMVFISVYAFWKGLKNRGWGIFAGIAFGLALATKINSYFVPFILGAWLIVAYRDRIIPLLERTKGRASGLFAVMKSIPPAIYSFVFLSPLVFLAAWPWLWYDTLERYLALLATKDTIRIGAYYLGSVWNGDLGILPWHYTWVMSAVTLPLAILVFCLLGSSRAIKDSLTLRNRNTILVLSGAVIPLLVFSSPFATLHGGVRIFLNVFPFMAILAGIGADMAVKFIGRYTGRESLIILLVAIVIAMPFAYSLGNGMNNVAYYYNELIGGPAGALRSGLEMDYNGGSYLDAVMWLNDNADTDAKIYAPTATNLWEMYKYGDVGLIADRFYEGRHHLNKTLPGLDISMFEQRGLLREDIEIAEMNESDYFIILNRRSVVDSGKTGSDVPPFQYYLNSCEPAFTVLADGAPLSYVFRTRCDPIGGG